MAAPIRSIWLTAFLVACLASCQGASLEQERTFMALARSVPFGSTREQVTATLHRSGVTEVSFDSTHRTLYAKLPRKRTKELVSPVELLEFIFTADDRLIEVRIKRRFVAP